jgi:hypothetical protein
LSSTIKQLMATTSDYEHGPGRAIAASRQQNELGVKATPSSDDLYGEAGRATTGDEVGNRMPVDMIGEDLGVHPWQTEPAQPLGPPHVNSPVLADAWGGVFLEHGSWRHHSVLLGRPVGLHSRIVDRAGSIIAASRRFAVRSAAGPHSR